MAPIVAGDEVSFYANVERVGRTYMAIKVEAWSRTPVGEALKRLRYEGAVCYAAHEPWGSQHKLPPIGV